MNDSQVLSRFFAEASYPDKKSGPSLPGPPVIRIQPDLQHLQIPVPEPLPLLDRHPVRHLFMQAGQQGVSGFFQFRPFLAQVQLPVGEGPDQVSVGPGPELFAFGTLERLALLEAFGADARDAQGMQPFDQDAQGQGREGREFQEAFSVQFGAYEGAGEAHSGQLGQGQGIGGVAHGTGPEGLAFGLAEEAQLPGRVQHELPGAQARHVLEAIGPGLFLGGPDHGRQPPPDAARRRCGRCPSPPRA